MAQLACLPLRAPEEIFVPEAWKKAVRKRDYDATGELDLTNKVLAPATDKGQQNIVEPTTAAAALAAEPTTAANVPALRRATPAVAKRRKTSPTEVAAQASDLDNTQTEGVAQATGPAQPEAPAVGSTAAHTTSALAVAAPASESTTANVRQVSAHFHLDMNGPPKEASFVTSEWFPQLVEHRWFRLPGPSNKVFAVVAVPL